MPYAAVPIFMAALAVARAAHERGILTHEEYWSVASRSSEFNTLGPRLEDEKHREELRGAVCASAVVSLRPKDFPECTPHSVAFEAPGHPQPSLWARLRGLRRRRDPDPTFLDPALLATEGFDLRASEEVNNHLRELFAVHGIDATVEGGWLVFSDRPIKLNGTFCNRKRLADAYSIQLDICVWLADEHRLMVESSGGGGATVNDAKGMALEGFIRNTWHVILAAFFGYEGDQADRSEVTVGGMPKTLLNGGVFVRGPAGFIPDATVKSLYGQLEAEIGQASVSRGTHWVRVYYYLTTQLLMGASPCDMLAAFHRGGAHAEEAVHCQSD